MNKKKVAFPVNTFLSTYQHNVDKDKVFLSQKKVLFKVLGTVLDRKCHGSAVLKLIFMLWLLLKMYCFN